ncbi:hypothetical protein TREMEDRAFT_28420 [Tremella mesenterica DSM 1558]|uniref:uncharacterized protein n=1 Tax=Tremella mesenterica (strain ATCC 24925 / CBS 8224 / DSM 1558 / NBRC 9311 / NRRL Y-6157 / RJB 2259-6 / UBC 559-6) TaxID=578456 RepID=UPI0003F499F7|nr:uncharacterized protein TREMEDRAFT_28420 [Tremella mesenterica DSM 1558]EIW70925.1 hypothetical protein TREMEDRAFT_28420 [Tremella mesenterica DSM 1558]
MAKSTVEINLICSFQRKSHPRIFRITNHQTTLLDPLSLQGEKVRETEEEQVERVQPSGTRLISFEEVKKHNKRDDCWVIINGTVYDVTDFLPRHPGGPGIILANSGRDATQIFRPVHPPDALSELPPSSILGSIDPTTIPQSSFKPPTTSEKEETERINKAKKEMPNVEGMMLADDFEYWAERVLGGTAWAYYKSAAAKENPIGFLSLAIDDLVFWRDVSQGNIETEFVGMKSTLPIYISPAAMAKLGHPLGEVNLTKAAGRWGIIQGISINASCSLDEILSSRIPNQKIMFQIYLNKNRSASASLLQKVTQAGVDAIIFTVDNPGNAKRTMDVRAKHSGLEVPINGPNDRLSRAPMGIGEIIGGYQDRRLVWDDVGFIRKYTNLPIIIKGVQCIEDVELCVKAGVQGVILSNHGGRQVDYAPAPIDILYELRTYRPDLFEKIDVMIDGGIRSGSDVVKALALGAKAVGIGRSFLYANGTHGQEGVERLCEILEEEITNTMRNMGVSYIHQLRPEMVGPAGPWVGMSKPSYWNPPSPPSPSSTSSFSSF